MFIYRQDVTINCLMEKANNYIVQYFSKTIIYKVICIYTHKNGPEDYILKC